jgi:hypothetical protein
MQADTQYSVLVRDFGQEPLEDGFAPPEVGKRDPLVG